MQVLQAVPRAEVPSVQNASPVHCAEHVALAWQPHEEATAWTSFTLPAGFCAPQQFRQSALVESAEQFWPPVEVELAFVVVPVVLLAPVLDMEPVVAALLVEEPEVADEVVPPAPPAPVPESPHPASAKVVTANATDTKRRWLFMFIFLESGTWQRDGLARILVRRLRAATKQQESRERGFRPNMGWSNQAAARDASGRPPEQPGT